MPAKKRPAAVTVGSVVATFHAEIADLCRELEQRRQFAAQLAQWFKEHPEREAEFAVFQKAITATIS